MLVVKSQSVDFLIFNMVLENSGKSRKNKTTIEKLLMLMAISFWASKGIVLVAVQNLYVNFSSVTLSS